MFKRIAKGNITGFIEIYRFISVFLTAFFYLIRGLYEGYSISVMLFIVVSITVSTALLQYLYRTSYNIGTRLQLLLLIEIAGLSFLMLFTGGLESPFIWCFLNPLLIISYHMPLPLKVIYLASNFFVLCGAGYFVERPSGLGEYLIFNSNIILTYTLLLILVNVLFKYHKRIVNSQKELEAAYRKLENYNARIKGMTADILSMYKAVQAVPGRGDKREIVNMVLNFAGRVLPGCDAYFMLEGCEEVSCLVSAKRLDPDAEDSLVDMAKSLSPDTGRKGVTVRPIDDGLAAFIEVSGIKRYGFVGLIMPGDKYRQEKEECEANLLLLSKLAATFFDKIESESISNELAVADEQDRIADDIHDSVIQRLFASSCFAHDTINKWNEISEDARKEQLILIAKNIQSSLKDLRSTIYNLSSKKQQVERFKESVRDYLRDMQRLSGVDINLDVKGETGNISLSAKKALYRIITECTGNAVRHAKCRNIWVSMNVSEGRTFLCIRDDGIGLAAEKAESEEKGLGLKNVKNLVRLFNGTIKINAADGPGTVIEIEFMNPDIFKDLAGNG